MSGETLNQVLARLGMTVGPSERQFAPARMGRKAVRRADGTLFCDGTAGELWEALQKEGLYPSECPHGYHVSIACAECAQSESSR